VSFSQNGTGVKPAIEESSANTGPTAHARTAAVSTISVTTLAGLELLDEQSFTKMLCLERKRTERSGRRFVLVLVDVTAVLRSGGKQSLFNQFANALAESTRETDIKGWYKAGSVLGLIFTEIGDLDDAAITTVLLTKVTKALYGTLSVNDANNIRVTCHVYPEDVSRSGDGGPVDFALTRGEAVSNSVLAFDDGKTITLVQRPMNRAGCGGMNRGYAIATIGLQIPRDRSIELQDCPVAVHCTGLEK